MRDLNYQLKQLCRHRREGAYGTQNKRERMLTLIANQLHALGYRGMTTRLLKPKHVEALVKLWFDQGLSIGTLKNRMAAIRWWAHKVDRQNVVARANEHYGIPDRRFVTNESKAKAVTRAKLDKVRDQHVRMSLELQQAFGLRREEAMKFQPSFADRGDHLVLKASWTKGGRERTVPIRTEAQRDVLNRARRLAGLGSLIPSNRNYVQQLRIYEGNTLRAGLSNMHGLRHAYAQNRAAANTPPASTVVEIEDLLIHRPVPFHPCRRSAKPSYYLFPSLARSITPTVAKSGSIPLAALVVQVSTRLPRFRSNSSFSWFLPSRTVVMRSSEDGALFIC